MTVTGSKIHLNITNGTVPLPLTNLFVLKVLKFRLKHNTDGWGNKLVTIFARHLDNFILTINFSLICQIRDFGSGQILLPRQISLSPGFAKIAPWWLVRRDYFLAKVPGLVSAVGATNVYSLNRRAVIANGKRNPLIKLRITKRKNSDALIVFGDKKETLFSERRVKDAIFNDVLVIQRYTIAYEFCK